MLLFLIVMLGLLDYYFLREADLLRILYNQVRAQPEDAVDFSMDAAQYGDDVNRLHRNFMPFPVYATLVFYSVGVGIILLGIFPVGLSG